MAFTGTASYSADSALPEIAEDVADIVSIVSPYETPLLDHLGDAIRPATSIRHEWLEDEPPSGSAARDRAMSKAATTGDRRAVAEYLRLRNKAAGQDEQHVKRIRKGNWTQVFTAAVQVNAADMAVRTLSIADEMDYQKQERLRELLRELESTVVNGLPREEGEYGDISVRRTMSGIIPFLTTNVFRPGHDNFPADTQLTEEQLNVGLQRIYDQIGVGVDTIAVGGYQKRRINRFIPSARAHDLNAVPYRDLVSVYEPESGRLCRVILCRAVPPDMVLLLDSSRINVLPLAGRSFHYKFSGDHGGDVIGEYTLELRNENCHGLIRGLETA